MRSQPLFNGSTQPPAAQRWYNRMLPTLPQQFTTNHYTSIAIFIVGTWLSRNALLQFGVKNLIISTVAAFVLQWFLTKAEQPLWARGMPFTHRFTIISLFALVVDVTFNSVGAWPYVRNLGSTDIWKMIQEMTSTADAPNKAIIIGICAAIGLFIAGAVEYFWNLDSEA